MITFLINISTPAKNFSARHKEFVSMVSKYEKDFEIIFLAKSDYADIDCFKVLASQLPKHHLIVVNKANNENEKILLGISASNGQDVLLSTLNTKLEVVEQILKKRKEGCELVFVRKKHNKFVRFFESLGLATYNLGLRMIGHNKDAYCETEVQLIDGRVANLICASPSDSKELRITNNYKQLKQGIVEEKDVYEQPQVLPSKHNAMFSIGWCSLFYIISFFCMAIISPFFHNFTYSWWIIIALLIWIGAGILGVVYISKILFKHRIDKEIRINENGDPIITVTEIVNFGDTVSINPVLYDMLFPEQAQKEQDKELTDKTLTKDTIKDKKTNKKDTKKTRKTSGTNKTESKTKSKTEEKAKTSKSTSNKTTKTKSTNAKSTKNTKDKSVK